MPPKPRRKASRLSKKHIAKMIDDLRKPPPRKPVGGVRRWAIKREGGYIVLRKDAMRYFDNTTFFNGELVRVIITEVRPRRKG